MSDKRKEPAWQGMGRFTRGLFFFLAGLVAFFLRGHVGPPAAQVLVGLGIVLFLVGFAIASQAIARQWQETVAGQDRDDGDEE